MEKTLTIDGKQVKFKSTGALLKRYRTQFGKDLIPELAKMKKLQGVKPNEELTEEQIKCIDFDTFFDIAWTLAKTADKNIPDPINWLDEFDEFPILDIVPELMVMLESNLQSTKKK